LLVSEDAFSGHSYGSTAWQACPESTDCGQTPAV
jgi:hypothetical protein